jgi:PKD repeat protein
MNNQPASYYLDSKVIHTMLLLSLAALLFMAFRYTNQKPCSFIDFTYRTANKLDAAFTREPVYFSAVVQNASEWQWDFGDQSPVDKTSGPFVTHEYKQPGQYTVRLIVNNNCQEARTIHVNRRETAGKKLVMRPYWPPTTLYAGREYYFVDSTAGANTWSWYFADEPRISRQSIAYQFLEPGPHKVVLVVNDDIENNRIEKTFTVLPPQKTNPLPQPSNRNQAGGNYNRPNQNTGANNGPIQNDPNTKPLTDYIGGDKNKAAQAPALSDNALRIAVLSINGNGYNEIRKHLKNNNFSNCTIIFNNRQISVDQLKENISVYAQYADGGLEVKQETDAANFMKAIDIKAKLKSKGKFMGIGGKERKFPH